MKGEIMKTRKPFSVVKWLIFPSLSLALAAIIVWFNLTVFGWQDGAVYMGVVGAITLFSIVINKYVRTLDDDDPTNDRLAVAAFVFEIILTVALIINAAYSLSVQREMSIARQSEQGQSKDLETATRFRSRRAQSEAAQMLREQGKGGQSSQAIFAANERPLFWIMIGELAAYGVAAFTLLAVSSLGGRGGGASHNAPQSPAIDRGEDFPSELDTEAGLRQPRQGKTNLATVATEPRAVEILRAHLKAIARDYPKQWFRADSIVGGVQIRMFERNRQGREVTIARTNQSNKLLAAVNRPDFRERLIGELVACGFPIGEGE